MHTKATLSINHCDDEAGMRITYALFSIREYFNLTDTCRNSAVGRNFAHCSGENLRRLFV